jgi:hypothetical protein
MVYRHIPVVLEHRITCQNVRCFHTDNGVLIAYMMDVAEWILFEIHFRLSNGSSPFAEIT